MKIAISAESTVDIQKDLLEKFDIKVVPFMVLLGEESYLDGEIPTSQIFDYVEENNKLPKTSAVNEFQFEEHFNSLLKDYDAIIHFSLSSTMSSAFNNAKNVASKLKNVFVIDSQSLSTGIALLCIYARKLADKGLEAAEIAKKAASRVAHVQASFVLNTVEYLFKGGRCSSLQRFGANLLRLKPQIIVKKGKMVSGKMYRGKNKEVADNYCKDTLKTFNNPDKSVAFVTYSSASPDMLDACRSALAEKGFETIYETTAGATVSSHCGPKCIGILYINDGDQAD